MQHIFVKYCPNAANTFQMQQILLTSIRRVSAGISSCVLEPHISCGSLWSPSACLHSDYYTTTQIHTQCIIRTKRSLCSVVPPVCGAPQAYIWCSNDQPFDHRHFLNLAKSLLSLFTDFSSPMSLSGFLSVI